MVIYTLTNKINQKVYVGKTVQTMASRLTKHRYKSRSDTQFPLYRAIRKYGMEAFEVRIIEQVEPSVDLDEREKFWIRTLRSNEKAFGYNLTVGGGGGDTFTNNPNKEIIRAKLLGRKTSEKTKLQQSNAHLGKVHGPMSEAQKQKIRATNLAKGIRPKVFPSWQGVDHPMYGKNHTEEARQKMSEGQKLAYKEGRRQHTDEMKRSKKAAWTGQGNPNYIEVDREILWEMVLSGVKITTMFTTLGLSRGAVVNKIKKEFGKTITEIRLEHGVPLNKRQSKG